MPSGSLEGIRLSKNRYAKIDTLILSIGIRLKVVRKAKGYYTKY